MGSNGGVYMIWSAAEARQLYIDSMFRFVSLLLVIDLTAGIANAG